MSFLRDLTGLLEEQSQKNITRKNIPHQKKKHGIYETPDCIAKFLFLVVNAHVDAISSVLDPACGSGNLLDPFWENLPECPTTGIDTDRISLMLAEIRACCRQVGRAAKWGIHKFDTDDFLGSTFDRLFDVIVANPPWGLPKSQIKTYERGEFPTSFTNQADSWALFMEKATNLLASETGLLAFIIPNTLCLNPNFETFRAYLLKSFTILLMLNLGERIFPMVTQPALLIVIKNTTAPPNHEIVAGSFVGTDTQIGRTAQLAEWLPKTQEELKIFLSTLKRFSQQEFCDTPGYRMELFSDLMATAIIQKLQQVSPYSLGDFVTNGRGVEIGKHAEVAQCPHCGRWNPPPAWKKGKQATCNHCHEDLPPTLDLQRVKIISRDPKNLGDESTPLAEVIVGEQVSNFAIRGQNFIRLDLDGINYKPRSTYDSPKILIRKTGREINAAIDWNNRFTVQVVYIFKLKESPPVQVPIEVLLCFLNSHLLLFYYYHRFGDPEKHNYAHYIQKHLKLLPMLGPETLVKCQQAFQSLFALCKKYGEFGAGGISEEDRQTVDALTYSLYQLTPDEIAYVDRWVDTF
jgi:tRNA1(Val) A37 N6-methylase TrmN6